MKYFIMVNGNLVEANLEQIQNKSVTLYDEDGVEVRKGQVETSNVQEDEELKNLTSAIASLTEKVDGWRNLESTEEEDEEEPDEKNAEIETLKAKISDMETAISKGLPIGTPGVEVGEDKGEILSFVGKFYDLNRQGREMQRKSQSFLDPAAKMTDDRRNELVKYFGLVALASKRHATPTSMKAMELLERYYGTADKTVLGDTGNVFPVPDIVDSEIFTFARERSIILQYGRVWEMTSEKMSFPSETAAVSVYWGNTTQESEPTVTEVELTATELSAYSAVRNTTLADARSDIVSWLGEALAEAAGLELDNKAFNGVGTDSPFICSGLLSAAVGYSVALASGSTAFSQLSATKLSEMISKLDGLKKQGARFFMHGEIIHYVRDLKDTNNRPIFIETVGAPMSGTIWGYPYTEVIKCPSTTGANTAFVSFGNLRHFAVGRRLGVTTLDVNPYLLWTTNRTAYKLYQRWGMGIALANGLVRLLTASS